MMGVSTFQVLVPVVSHSKGDGVQTDVKKAVELFHRAANGGYAVGTLSPSAIATDIDLCQLNTIWRCASIMEKA